MPALTFYYAPGACSLAPHIILKEIGADFKTVGFSIQGAPEEFRKVNPKMRVPVLTIDGEVITEVPAIMTAISQLAPERNLLGRSNLEIVRAYEWMNWLSGSLHGQGFGALFRPGRYSDNTSIHEQIQLKGWNTIQECYSMIEEKLQGVHAVGEQFTVIDAYLYVFYRWGASRTDMQAKYPKYARLIDELLKRESTKAALEAEEIETFAPKF